MRPDLRQWQGVIFATVALVATLWLAASGQLNFYIHPRYIVFTVVMATIGILFVIASCAFRLLRSDDDDHDHDHDHADGHAQPIEKSRRRFRPAMSILGAVLAAIASIGLIVLPPATLTSATAGQRAINSTALDSSGDSEAADLSTTSAAAFEKFTVLDWASVLRQTSDLSFYAEKPVRVVGFVTADADDPENVFYVSRFIVTCCAVDAQPVGVPVYLENWADTYSIDEWVEVSGSFTSNPSRTSAQTVALEPGDIEKVGTPDEPYLY